MGVVGGVVMDSETAETLAGVVRLLRRGGQPAWVRAEVERPRSPRQLVALGIEVARNLLPDGVDLTGPTPIGDDPVGLLRSAEQLLRTITGVPAAGDAARLRVRVTDLVGEANTSAGGAPSLASRLREMRSAFPRRRRRLHHLPRTLQLRRRHPYQSHLRNPTIGRR